LSQKKSTCAYALFIAIVNSERLLYHLPLVGVFTDRLIPSEYLSARQVARVLAG
jgi:hypothetical protein